MSETSSLLRAYHERGDDAARRQLVELYLPLVESFTRRYARSADEHDDLYQVGCIGLINAIDRFDLERGDELAAFAVPNIAGEIRRYLRDRGGSVRLPRRVQELRSGAVQAQAELRSKLGREPSASEIAMEVGASEDDVALALDAGAAQAVELQPGDIEGASFDAIDDRLFLSDAFRGLDERERRIMYLRYIRDAEPDAIAAELGISRRQVARNTDEALKKLRHGLERPGAAPSPKPPQRGTAKPKMAVGADPSDLDRQIDQPYHIELVKSDAPGGGWSAKVEELAGCTAEGSTPEEAATRVQEAMRTWIADAVAAGREVPKPRSVASHSGRLLVRMPQSLHAELARAAERDEISLNQFITGSLASAVNWRGPGVEPIATESGADSQPRTRTLRTALMVNVLLLVLIAVLAIALLVVAVSRG
ncbi:MAG TPA: sigma-70 family RNA polymerase sigma factor [Thermoleophilaceae bacterium]|nr:sigma-70 family RNA polymerase sigma factor [Thermoleophilaceae bacterium]